MNILLKKIQLLWLTRWPWLVLAAIAFSLDGAALFIQHVLKVEPCNECIYVRAGVLGIGVASLFGALAPKYLAMRFVGLTACTAALGWSLYRVNLLLDLERVVREGGEASCKRFKGFPDWLPLDTWLPEVFEPRAMCGTVSWTFLGQSVTFWAGAALLGIALVISAALLAQTQRAKLS